MRVHVLLFAVAALAGSPAHALEDSDKGKVIEKPVIADSPEAFAQQAAWIEQEMQPAGRYEFTKPADKQRVKVLLSEMSGMLQRAGSVASMDQETRVRMFNDQEEVNGLLKHNDANRLVCESHQPVGSHIPVTTCHTFRQIEAAHNPLGAGHLDSSRQCNALTGNSTNACPSSVTH